MKKEMELSHSTNETVYPIAGMLGERCPRQHIHRVERRFKK